MARPPGKHMKDVRHGDEIIEHVFVFPLNVADEVFATRGAATELTLRLERRDSNPRPPA